MIEQGELFIRATRKTPEVRFTRDRFMIEGRSIPENPGVFYRPIYDWFLTSFKNDGEVPLLEFAFDYLNTASAKWIFLILRGLTTEGKRYKLIWYYETGDEDMLDLGEMFKNLLGCQFTAIEVDEIPGVNQNLAE
jgi:hypothetical protein